MTNDDKDLKLKECPFCGGMPILKQWPQLNKLYLGDDSKSIWSIFCSNCLFEGIRHSKEIVLLKWNTRHPQQPSEPLKKLDEQAVSDELQLRYFKLMSPDVTESDAEIVANSLSKAICSKFGQPSEQKYKAEAIYEAIKKSDVGDDIVIHNEDMSVWCILNLVTREHPERESNGKDRG